MRRRSPRKYTGHRNKAISALAAPEQQIIPGERLLGFEMARDVHWNCLGIEDDQFINTDNDFAQAPDLRFWVQEDGKLSGGTDALAKLRQAISQFLDDVIYTLREELRMGR